MSVAMIELPRYRSHKLVWALKIEAVIPNPRGFELHFEDKRYAPHEVSAEWLEKRVTSPGGYWVLYEDGYESWSPAAAFEAGNRPYNGMTFGDAIEALKAGQRVARTGWNGKGMWLSLSSPTAFDCPAERFWSPHNRAHAEEQGGSAKVLPSITMKTATGEILMGWLASQTDMLAEDWMVVG